VAVVAAAAAAVLVEAVGAGMTICTCG